MIVIFDYKYLKLPGQERAITQMAAMRVDEDWNAIGDMYFAIIAPQQDEKLWNAYKQTRSGKSQDSSFEFIGEAMRRLDSWLQDDDVFYVWGGKKTKSCIRNNWERYTGHQFPCPIVNAVQRVHDSYDIISGRKTVVESYELYDIARAKQIEVERPYGYASADVVTEQRLYKKLIMEDARNLINGWTSENLPTIRARENMANILNSNNRYFFTPDSKIFHIWTCPHLLQADSIEGARSYVKAEATGRRPCKVCKPPIDSRKIPKQQTRANELEKHYDSSEIVSVLLVNGQFAKVTKGSIVGCCHSDLHKGKLTKKLMEEHDCLGKNCVRFEKYEDTADYWRRCALKKDRKDQIRAIKNAERARHKLHEAVGDDIAETAAQMYDGEMLVTRVNRDAESCVIFYVSHSRENDEKAFDGLADDTRKRFGFSKVTLRHCKGLDGRYATIEDYKKVKK